MHVSAQCSSAALRCSAHAWPAATQSSLLRVTMFRRQCLFPACTKAVPPLLLRRVPPLHLAQLVAIGTAEAADKASNRVLCGWENGASILWMCPRTPSPIICCRRCERLPISRFVPSRIQVTQTGGAGNDFVREGGGGGGGGGRQCNAHAVGQCCLRMLQHRQPLSLWFARIISLLSKCAAPLLPPRCPRPVAHQEP